MAIGRITGQMLFSNLERQGVDLAIDGNLIVAAVTTRRVGINNTTPQYSFDSSGNVKLANLIVTHNRITSNTGKIDLGSISNVQIAGGATNFVIFTDGNGNLGFGNIDTLANGAITGNGIVGNVNTANVAFFTNVTATTTTGTYYPPLYVTTTGNSKSFVATAFNYNPGTMILTVPTTSITKANITTANVSQLTVADGFWSDNVIITGGYVNNLANVSAALGYVAQLNSSAANVTGPLFATSINSANVSFTGTTTGTVSAANVSLFDNVTLTVLNGVYYPSLHNKAITGNSASFVSSFLSYVPASGNLSANSVAAVNNLTANVLVTDFITNRANNSIRIETTSAVGLPTGNSIQRPAGPDIGFFRYNNELARLEYYDGDAWITVELNAPSIGSQTFNGDGTALSYALNSPNETAQSLLVSINGTTQVPDVSYSVTANVITFSEPPLSTDTVDIRFLSVGYTIGGNIGTDLLIQTNTAAISTTTGALQVVGGVGVQGNLHVGGNVVLATGVNSNMFVGGNITPTSNVTYNLGSSSLRWKDLWLSGTTIYLGGATLGTSGTDLVFTNAAGGNLRVSGSGTSQVFDVFGNLEVTGSILPMGANTTQNIGSTTQWFNTFYGKSTQAVYADLAENYTSDADYAPGTVVIFGGPAEITIATQSHDTRVAGVISTNPAYLMNSTAPGLPVAMTGRVPCRVQGPVKKGDVLVSGTAPGTAQRIGMNWQPGCVLGKALESIGDAEIAVIEVVVGRF
jgi:hypothetical protein